MAKTSAERQAAYRARRAGKDSSERRLNTWVSAEAYAAIDKLARRYGVTRRSVIELLVCNEDGKLKELKAGVEAAKPVVAKKSQAGPSRGKASAEAVAAVAQPKQAPAKKLPRNPGAKVVKEKVKKQPAKTAASKPSRSTGDQFGFEF